MPVSSKLQHFYLSSEFKAFFKLLILVCVCVFILFHLVVSSGCATSVTYVRCSDQRSFVASISWVLLPSAFISISEPILFHLRRQKLQSATAGEKTNDIAPTFRKDDILI